MFTRRGFGWTDRYPTAKLRLRSFAEGSGTPDADRVYVV
jgi:hypothetical protein